LKKGLAACTPQKLFVFYAGRSNTFEKSRKSFLQSFFQKSDRFIAFLIP
jgi:hypothetical protein